MIIQLSITNDRAAKILEAIGQPYERHEVTDFRSEGHNKNKEYQREVLLVQVGKSFMPAKEWIENTLNDALLDVLKQGVNIKK